MAEFPYPEYRNLWTGSKLSEDYSAIGKSSSHTWEQVEDGVQFTTIAVVSGASSYVWTSSGYRVPVESNKPYSWRIPVRNPGAVPYNLAVYTWLERSTSGSDARAVRAVIQPGERRDILLEGLMSEDAKDIRFSFYYSADDPKPEVGAQIVLMDGITLVQSATVPPFPFNGDGVMPAETLKRRNINPDPKVSSLDFYRNTGNDVATVVSDEGSPAIELLEGASPNTTLYIDPVANWRDTHGLSAGQWLAHSAEVKAVNGYTNTTSSIARVMSYNNGSINTGANPSDYELSEESYKRVSVARQIATIDANAYFRTLIWPSAAPGEGSGYRVRRWVVAVGNTQAEALEMVATYFDGDTAPSGNLSHRWAPDGTSLEVETIQPPAGRTTVWDGEPYKSTSTLWVGDTAYATGVMDVGIATEARLGIVADVYSRSREKIQLELARVDSQLIAGERVELDAAAMTASPVVWHWRQITGPTVVLEPHEASLDFIAPDVDEDTTVRIAVYAASEDGRNRSDWHYFDLTIKPPMARFRASGSLEFEPVSPKYVGYDRGKREIWNDVIPPPGFSPNARHETEIIDLGILPDDVQFTTGGPPEVAAAGGIYVDLETGDIYRNFGAGYNETDDTTAAPRTNAWWVNPATGDILEWIED